ncbi:MAG TPA: nitroreductase/quinone reductase family protein [Thermomicrobiaceae bacterium]|nr:nitroreductase/quinone reductase family protein [Thermomicrobiaceae bacterium]
MHAIAASRLGAWLLARTVHHLDRRLLGRWHGRWATSTLAGLPTVLLTTTGARTGRPRSVPLVGIPDGERIILVASRFGGAHHPAWYHNLKARPECLITLDGQTGAYRAREATRTEREQAWRLATACYPGYAAYQARSAGRLIPVMILTPASAGAG